MRTAVRQTRPTERLIHLGTAKAPEGVRAPEAMALETIRLVLPNSQASVFIQFYFFRIERFGVVLCVDTTAKR